VLGVRLLGVLVAVARGEVGPRREGHLGWVWGLLLTNESVVQVGIVFSKGILVDRGVEVIVLVAVLHDVRLDYGPSFPRMEAALVGVVTLGISLVEVLGRKGVPFC
jgi:hypothetical protein